MLLYYVFIVNFDCQVPSCPERRLAKLSIYLHKVLLFYANIMVLLISSMFTELKAKESKKKIFFLNQNIFRYIHSNTRVSIPFRAPRKIPDRVPLGPI